MHTIFKDNDVIFNRRPPENEMRPPENGLIDTLQYFILVRERRPEIILIS